MPNLELTPLPLSPWRKIALGTWNGGGDPSVYGILEVNATRLREHQRRYAERTGGKPPTVTAIVSTAVGRVLAEHPQINGLIRWGKIYQRKTVTLFLQTAVDDQGKELSGVTITDADTKSVSDVLDELRRKAAAIREDRDPAFSKAKSTFAIIPAFLMHTVLSLISFFCYTLNLDPRPFGLPRDAMGSVMITSIGTLGLDLAFAPLVPYSRVPLLLAVGAIREQPVVEGGAVVVAPMFKICATFDHRFIDGIHAAKMAKSLHRLLETEEGLTAIGLV